MSAAPERRLRSATAAGQYIRLVLEQQQQTQRRRRRALPLGFQLTKLCPYAAALHVRATALARAASSAAAAAACEAKNDQRRQAMTRAGEGGKAVKM